MGLSNATPPLTAATPPPSHSSTIIITLSPQHILNLDGPGSCYQYVIYNMSDNNALLNIYI